MKIKNHLINKFKNRKDEVVIFVSKKEKGKIISFHKNTFGDIENVNLYGLDYLTSLKLNHGSINVPIELFYKNQHSYDVYQKYKEEVLFNIHTKWTDLFQVHPFLYIDFNKDSIYEGKDELCLFKLKNKKILQLIPNYILQAIKEIKQNERL